MDTKYEERISECRIALRGLIAQAEDFAVCLDRLQAGESSSEAIQTLELQSVLLDEAYSKCVYLRNALHHGASGAMGK